MPCPWFSEGRTARAAFTGFAEQLLRQDVEMGAVL